MGKIEFHHDEYYHIEDSGKCRETCGQGAVPLRTSGVMRVLHWFTRGEVTAIYFDGELVACEGWDYDGAVFDPDVAAKMEAYLNSLSDQMG